MRLNIFLVLTIFFISSCFAQCNSGQVDINSASLTDLDKLTGIGPAYAQGIVDGRPYSTLDELDKVKGIGPKTLEKIKAQGLACISSGIVVKSEEEISEISSKIEELEEDISPTTYSPQVTSKVIQETQINEPIGLAEEQTGFASKFNI